MADHPKYLRQLKTGRIYPWSEAKSIRKDMVPLDLDRARARIEANRRIIEQAQVRQTPEEIEAHTRETNEAIALAAELTASENAIDALQEQQLAQVESGAIPPPMKTPEEVEQERREKIIDADGEVQQILAMKKKADLVSYIIREYGVDLPSENQTIETLRTKAVKLRVQRIFEGV